MKTKRLARRELALTSAAQHTCEAGGWIRFCEPVSVVGADANALLALAVDPRPGNLRVALDDGRAYQLGELRDRLGLLTIHQARQRLIAGHSDSAPETAGPETAGPETAGPETAGEELASLLAETGYVWSPADAAPKRWHAVTTDPSGCRCELTVDATASGVQTQGLLATWETELSDTSLEAIARFLLAAHARVRFARFVLLRQSLSAVSLATVDRLDVELPDSVFAVVAACRLVHREVGALAIPNVARAYLDTIT